MQTEQYVHSLHVWGCNVKLAILAACTNYKQSYISKVPYFTHIDQTKTTLSSRSSSDTV